MRGLPDVEFDTPPHATNQTPLVVLIWLDTMSFGMNIPPELYGGL